MSASDIPDQVQERLRHIAEVSKNARTTWFGLIGVLLFSTIAIGGVADRDFFTYESSVQLPLVGVSVPVVGFFYAGPLIVLGLYTYFHLYLIKLWRALSWVGAEAAPGLPLDDVAYPWLISDAAILRKPGAEKRVLGWLTQTVSLALGWAAGPAVLAFFWYRSFPPHDAILTAWCGLLFVISVIGCVTSYRVWVATMKEHATAQQPEAKHYAPRLIEMILFAAAVLFIGWESTKGDYLYRFEETPFSANLYRAELAERPDDWLPYEEARAEFFAKYSGLKRSELPADGDPAPAWAEAAETAFKAQRNADITALRAKDFPNVNLVGANLDEAFMPGLDLRRADLRGASMIRAQLERADLWEARLEAAILVEARLEGARLIGARLQAADLRDARMDGAVLIGARLDGASLVRARLEKADLDDTQMAEANFSDARMDEARFFGAQVDGAKFTGAHMNQANLGGAQLASANLIRAQLDGADLSGARLYMADLTDADLEGASVAVANFANSNITFEQLDRAFGDAMTAQTLPDGVKTPEHWSRDDLTGNWMEARRQWCEWRVHRRIGPSPFCEDDPFNP